MPDRQSGRIVEAAGGGWLQAAAGGANNVRSSGIWCLAGPHYDKTLTADFFFVSWVIKVINILDECLYLNRKS